MLSASILEAEIRKFCDSGDHAFAGYPASAAEATEAWRSALATYLAGAVDASQDAIVAPPCVGPIFTSPVGTAASAAAAFELSVVTSLAGALFAVGIPPTPLAPCPSIGGTGLWSLEVLSVVVAVLPVIAVTVLPALAPGTGGKPGEIAAALHSAILSGVQVLITGLDTTVPVPLPITNLCGVT